MIRQRKGAFPVAVISLVTRGRHYPVIPAHVTEVHIQCVAPAVAVAFAAPLLGASLGPTGQRVTLSIVAKGDQEGAQLLPVLARLLVQRAADPNVSPLVARRLVEVQNLHGQPVIRAELTSPAQHGGADVKALPPRCVVVHEPGIQKLRDQLTGPRGFQHLIHVYSVKTLLVRKGVTNGLLDLMTVEPQLGRREQLVLWNAAEVEQKTKGRVAAAAELMCPLHVL